MHFRVLSQPCVSWQLALTPIMCTLSAGDAALDGRVVSPCRQRCGVLQQAKKGLPRERAQVLPLEKIRTPLLRDEFWVS